MHPTKRTLGLIMKTKTRIYTLYKSVSGLLILQYNIAIASIADTFQYCYRFCNTFLT